MIDRPSHERSPELFIHSHQLILGESPVEYRLLAFIAGFFAVHNLLLFYPDEYSSLLSYQYRFLR